MITSYSLHFFFYLGTVKQLPAASGRLCWPSSAGNWSPWEDGELILRVHEGTCFSVFQWVTAALCLGLQLCTRYSSRPNTYRCRFWPVLLLVLCHNVSSKRKKKGVFRGEKSHFRTWVKGSARLWMNLLLALHPYSWLHFIQNSA